ncbi:hypothetical protein C8R46DRAFT_1186830 [Mycena filopes]|nr:hypothetical protein C8R46DRAFT_1186830 [Mycena filopes]
MEIAPQIGITPATQTAGNQQWAFQGIFRPGEFLASGEITLHPRGVKAMTSTRNNTFVFHVMSGSVKFTIELQGLPNSEVVHAPGSVMVPRDSRYALENLSDQPALLGFTQAREAPPDVLDVCPLPFRYWSVITRPSGEAGKGSILCRKMKLEQDKDTYNAILHSVHLNIEAVGLDKKIQFRRQEPFKIHSVCQMTRDQYRYLHRFPGDWATRAMIKQYLSNAVVPDEKGRVESEKISTGAQEQKGIVCLGTRQRVPLDWAPGGGGSVPIRMMMSELGCVFRSEIENVNCLSELQEHEKVDAGCGYTYS